MAEAFTAASCANVVASFCWESILKPVGRQFGYVLFYGSYINDLNERVRELDATIASLEPKLRHAARSTGGEINQLASSWLEDAKGMSVKANKLLSGDQEQVRRTRCSRSNYFFPSPVWRYWNCRKVHKVAQSVRAKVAANKFDIGPINVPFLQSIVDLEGYTAFETRNSIVTGILTALGSKEGKRSIGVHGLPGVGKTTLVKAVAKQALDNNLFTDFVELAVSQSPNLEKIQQDIGDILGLQFKAVGLKGRARELRHRLKKEEKFLIILDDVWNKLNLVDIGIAFEDPHQMGCKILLTSRSKKVLQVQMDVHVENTFEVPLLSESEAWTCFSKIINDDAISAGVKNPESELLAIQIVKECAGLPLAILTVAGTLKCKHLHVWRDALGRLQSSSIDKKVESSIRLSYDFLKIGENHEEEGDQTQKLFLFCSLHEEDVNISIHDLLSLVIGWGLFQNVHTLEATRDRLQTSLDKLKAHGLLLKGTYNDLVKVHDVIRDFGISIASQEPNKMLYIRSNDELEECLDNNKLKDALAISLGAKYEGQSCLKCPKLRSLWIWRRRSELVDNFFENTKELRFLSLPGMYLKSLPPTLGFLHNLQGLRLVRAKLVNIDLIGDLKKLKVLDLRGSDLKELPETIGQLTSLKMLDLSDCRFLKVIPRNVISRLVNLEELNMKECSFNNWKAHDGSEDQENKVSLDEIKGLTKLTGLHLHVQESNMLPRDFFSTKLTRFNVSLGSSGFMHSRGLMKLAIYKFDMSSLQGDKGFNMLLKKSNVLRIHHSKGLQNRGFELGKIFGDGNHIIFSNLVTFHVSNMRDLEYICFGELTGIESLGRSQEASEGGDHSELAVDHCIVFPQLKSMTLSVLPKLIGFWSEGDRVSRTPTQPQNDEEDQELSSTTDSARILFNQKVAFPSLDTLMLSNLGCERIWAEQLPAGTSYSFQNLRTLQIEKCCGLKYALSFAIAESLVQLAKLEVRDCEEMEGILPEKTLLPKLKRVLLQGLQKLSRFCSTEIPLCCPNITDWNIKDCPSWSILFKEGDYRQDTNSDNKKAVCQLEIRSVSDQHLPRFYISYITTLEVVCVKSENLLSTSVVTAFVHLGRLVVGECEFMKAVVVIDNLKQEICLPALKAISLYNLPKLKSFCTGDHIQCQQPLFLGQKVSFPSLESLTLRGLNVKGIWWDENLGEISSSCNTKLQKLKGLNVDNCDQLKYLFSFPVARGLEQLNTLGVSNCTAMEEIVLPPLAAQLAVLDDRIEFSELKRMYLGDLPNEHIRFYSECDRGRGSSGDFATPFFNAKVSFPSLEELTLKRLNVKGIWWDGNLPEISSSCNNKLQKLRMLEVDSCDRLKYLFSFPVASGLKQLETLRVLNCTAMEEIVLPPLATQVLDDRIEFSKLKHMHLENLPNERIRFYSQCDQGRGSSGDSATPFFNAKVACPSLDHLQLKDLGCERICADQLPADTQYSFQNLRRLKVESCHRLKHALSFAIAESLVQLHTLEVRACREMEEILVVGINTNKNPVAAGATLQAVATEKKLLPNLVTVSLENLPKLEAGCRPIRTVDNLTVSTDLWKLDADKYRAHTTFQKLEMESLGISDCQRLKIPLPSWVSFRALTVVRVSHNNEMEYLLSPSAAKSLQLLKVMEICGCQSMKEIICSKDGDEEQQGSSSSSSLNSSNIVFNHLEFLVLSSLESLTSFHSGNCALEFPMLTSLVVGNCPEMICFCARVTITSPHAQIFLTTTGTKFWEVNVGRTSNNHAVVHYQIHKRMSKDAENMIKELGYDININTTIQHFKDQKRGIDRILSGRQQY